jgi:hypothetical protein
MVHNMRRIIFVLLVGALAAPFLFLALPRTQSQTFPGSLTNQFDAVFCNTIGYLIVRTAGAWTCGKGVPANVVWFGADPAGSSDSSTPAQNAYAAAGAIFFPPGTYTMNSPFTQTVACGKSITVVGSGVAQTIINWPGTGGFAITLACTNTSIHFRDMTITTSQANAGTAIGVTGANVYGYAPQSDITNVAIQGNDLVPGVQGGSHCFAYGIDLHAVSDVTITNTNTYGVWANPGGAGCGVGLRYQGDTGTSTYATILLVKASSFNLHAVGVTLGNWWQGVVFETVNFNGRQGTAGLQVPPSQAGTLSGLWIVNSQFDTGGNEIDINTGVSGLFLTSSEFHATTTNAFQANLGPSIFITVHGNVFVNPFSVANVTGVVNGGSATTSGSGTGIGNVFNNIALGWNLAFGAVPAPNWNISQNRYISVGTHTSNTTGSGTIIGTISD